MDMDAMDGGHLDTQLGGIERYASLGNSTVGEAIDRPVSINGNFDWHMFRLTTEWRLGAVGAVDDCDRRNQFSGQLFDVPSAKTIVTKGLVMNYNLLLRFALGTVLVGTQMKTAIAAEIPTSTKIEFTAPNQAQDSGEPGGRGRGGAGRGDCKAYQSLTALVPVVKLKTKDKVWGLTTRDRPTFWFAMPVALTPQQPIQFTLQGQDDNTIYKTTLNVKVSQAGIIQITIPETGKSLQIDQTYRWGFSVQCNAINTTETVFVRGSIRRVAIPTEIEQQLLTQQPIDRAMVYAKYGIWFDALTTLGQEMSQNEKPDRATLESWSMLLKQGNFANLSKNPIVPCCTVK
jgi:Domain of Unknown Function (DUF928)